MCRVSRSFESGRIAALTEISLAVERGQSIAITGPSGSGKSTLINIMCGLDKPDAGHVEFGGRIVDTAREWTSLRGDRIGIVFQHYHLLPTLSAAENVEAAMIGRVGGAKERRRRARDLLDQVGLSARLASRPADLSGGERQRVALARALANNPDLILADEPTGSLDQANGRRVLQLLGDLAQHNGTALVVITHDPDVAGCCRERIQLLDGKVISGPSR